jgi:hypothetical protein
MNYKHARFNIYKSRITQNRNRQTLSMTTLREINGMIRFPKIEIKNRKFKTQGKFLNVRINRKWSMFSINKTIPLQQTTHRPH